MAKKNSLIQKVWNALQGIVIKEALVLTVKFLLANGTVFGVMLGVYHWNFAPKTQERSIVYFEGGKLTDTTNAMIKSEIEGCKTDGIFVGFVGQYDGELKFLNLYGKWDFNLTKDEKDILNNPILVSNYLPTDEMKKNVSHILNACNSLMQTMSIGSTKDTNEIYTAVYREGGYSINKTECSIDENTKSLFKRANFNTLIDMQDVSSNFFNCIMQKLNLSEYYTASLKKVYIYPIEIKRYDIAFISLSFVNDESGLCFSKDDNNTNQRRFAEKIAKQLQQDLNW